jgi:hypothetical protein
MRIKTLLVALLLVPILLFGAVTYYIRGEARKLVDQAVNALSPVAEVRYAGVSVTFGGEVRVHGIDIRPRIINDSIRIEAIQYQTPGLWFLLTGTDALREGNLPEHSRIELQGIEIGLGGAIGDALDQLAAAASQTGASTPLSNCGEVRTLDAKTYRRLGYSAFVFDIGLGYRFEPDRGPLHVQTEVRTRDLGVANIDLEFSGAAARMQDMLASEPRLRRFALRYQDLSFTDRLKRFCAQAGDVSVDQFIEAEVNRSDAAYQAQWGFAPGAGLRQAYRHFLEQPGVITIEGVPSSEIDLSALRLFKPDDVVTMLNLRVSVNDQAVTDLSVSVGENVEAVKTPAPPARAAAVPAKPIAAAPSANVPARPTTDGYRAIAVRELGKYVGHTVRLHLTRGVVREGHLLQIRQGMARVERRSPGGAMTLAIPLGEIEHAEVLIR